MKFDKNSIINFFSFLKPLVNFKNLSKKTNVKTTYLFESDNAPNVVNYVLLKFNLTVCEFIRHPYYESFINALNYQCTCD